MSAGVGGSGPMTLQDFLRLYQPTALPTVQPQAAPLAALGQPQQPAQRQQGAGQGASQQGGSLPFLGQLAQIGGGLVGLGPNGQANAAQSGQAVPQGVQGVLMNAMNANGANGSSNALADAVGFTPFGTGSFG